MMRLHLKKQICMEVGCMQNEILIMDWIVELITLFIIVIMIISLITVGMGKAWKKWEDRNDR